MSAGEVKNHRKWSSFLAQGFKSLIPKRRKPRKPSKAKKHFFGLCTRPTGETTVVFPIHFDMSAPWNYEIFQIRICIFLQSKNLHLARPSHKQFISEHGPKVVRKGHNDLSKQSSGPQRLLSVHKARYVKHIIERTVEHLLHSQHHWGLFVVADWANTANVCMSKYLQTYIKFSEQIKDIREVTQRSLWNNRFRLHTQFALSQELAKCLCTELHRPQTYISHCALIRVLTQSALECVATTRPSLPLRASLFRTSA